jgi:hypothetical protein
MPKLENKHESVVRVTELCLERNSTAFEAAMVSTIARRGEHKRGL